MTLPEKVAAPKDRKRIIVHPDQVTQPDRRPWNDRPLEDVLIRFVLMSALFIGIAAVAIGLGLGLLRGGS
jgi:hypothetical protein